MSRWNLLRRRKGYSKEIVLIMVIVSVSVFIALALAIQQGLLEEVKTVLREMRNSVL